MIHIVQERAGEAKDHKNIVPYGSSDNTDAESHSYYSNVLGCCDTQAVSLGHVA
jgi:hypothetical protein